MGGDGDLSEEMIGVEIEVVGQEVTLVENGKKRVGTNCKRVAMEQKRRRIVKMSLSSGAQFHLHINLIKDFLSPTPFLNFSLSFFAI